MDGMLSQDEINALLQGMDRRTLRMAVTRRHLHRRAARLTIMIMDM